MRIAGKFFSPTSLFAGAVVVGICSFISSGTFAANSAPLVATPAPVAQAAPLVAAPVSQAPLASAQAAPVATANAAPSTSAVQASAAATPAAFQVPEAPKAEGDDIAKALSSMEDKVTDSAKSVVKRLDTTEATTISDLNSARQTVTRIEAMIDIEKRLGELEKLRNERNSRAFAAVMPMPSGLAGAIPASALQPLPGTVAVASSSVSASPDSPPVIRFGSGRPEISRISGTEGRYMAVLKLPDGEKKSVKVGDKLSHGTVRSITSSSVEVADKGNSYTLRVKNVDAIYSAMR